MRLLTRGSSATLVATLALTGALVLPTSTAAAAADFDVNTDQITLDQGHTDAFNLIPTDDGGIRLTLKEDITGSHVLREPESVEIYVKESARTQVPEGFLPGLPADVYLLPLTQGQNPDVIWPGWDSLQLSGHGFGTSTQADIEFNITEVDGPGDVFMWTSAGFNPKASLLKDGGYTLPNTIKQSILAHVHTNWAFTEAGTYIFTVNASAAKADGSGRATSNTSSYAFVVGERTALTPAAPTQSGNTVTIPEQKYLTYTDATGTVLAPGAHEITADLTVNATQRFGFDLAAGATAQWNFAYEAPVQQAVTITGLGHHYHQGNPINLTAAAAPAVAGASYEWSVQRKDQSAPVRVPGVTGANLLLTAEQAYDDARISVRLLGASGDLLAEAAPVTIDVNDHGTAPHQVVTVGGVRDHYHTGTIANLSASVAPASVLTRYEWQIKTAEMPNWATAPGENGENFSFTVTGGYNGMLVRAKLTFDDGTQYVVSEPVEIEVDDHHGHQPVQTELSISGLAASYRAGDRAQLTAVQQPQTNEDHYHWFIKRQGETTYTVIPGALSGALQYTVLAEDANAQIIARLYDHDHAQLAESAPVTLKLEVLAPTGPGKPAAAPEGKTGASLDGTTEGGIALDKSSVLQGGTVTVQVGNGTEHAGEWVAAWMFSNPALLGGDWQQVAANGTITVRIPANASPGAHRVAVFDRTGALLGWRNLQVTQAADHGKRLSDTGAESPAPLIVGGALLLLAGAAVVTVARRRMGAAE